MANIVPASEYRQLLLAKRPLIDVRAPIEFHKGAFPQAVNLPLMNDAERTKVGTCYKQQGQQAAIELGHSLVGGKIKQHRIDAWCQHIQQYPNSYLYCFRGGLRSQLTQQWLKDAGVDLPYIQGGYKAMRTFLINTIDYAAENSPILVISGSTGSGKTEFIHQRNDAIDLEGIANHRGSSFGRQISAQPSQINFENNLAIALLTHQKYHQTSNAKLIVEDESFLIGRAAIPHHFFQSMQQAPVVIVEQSFDERVQRLHQEYVQKMRLQFCQQFGEQDGLNAFADYLQQSITNIRKRLGGKQHDELQKLVQQALQQTHLDGHYGWIRQLLAEYYDPMYQYQLEKKANKIVFKGSHQAVHQWLDEH
ncbi:tRNA 2-selenouridine(34) synthase MnmH [Shewanella aestuarii]|uniref:tRNA 2-selenouridine synthase n=1 Tax=Shewanella aestuarii TaxID=1028752 RepID=A0A6G9QH07_9GAMM|nr:tRNA 2-selenouridine(34) synthase MnmH [Shewanella aestuarii]QIR13169.1 tRNA 2-selenouridine(34) synthase MnmH [Shewanella aestuarii]